MRIINTAITGVTAYDAKAFAANTAGLVGAAVPAMRIEEARQAILSRYRQDGYVLTSVFANIDRAGNLRFVVVEGRIADVRLEGDIGPAGTQVLKFLNRLTNERPISAATLERYLLLASDVPGVTIHTVLRPSTDEPGAITLVAQVSRQWYSGLIAADNRAFNLTGPEQLLAIGDLNSFTQFGERTEFSILRSFNNTQIFGQAATEFFVGGSGLKVRVYAGEGTIDPSHPLRDIGYHGTTRVFGAQASYPVIRSRQQTLYAVAALDAIESNVRTAADPSRTFDSLRVFRTGVDYALEDRIAGDSRPGVNTVTARLSQGVLGLGASSAGGSELGRAGERPDFFKLNAELTRTQTLFQPWEGASLALFGLVAGQVSASVLPPAEKFFLGGIRYNRGFYSGQVTGDNALTTSLELQLNTGWQFEAFGKPLDVRAQFYVFNDWGETWENKAQNIARDPNHRLHSAGFGVRAQLTRFTEFDVEAVERLTRSLSGQTITTAPDGTVTATPAPSLKAQALYWRVLTRF